MTKNIEQLHAACWDTMLTDPEAALVKALKSLDLVQSTQATALLPYNYRLIGLCHLYIGTFQEALDYLDRAIDAALESGDIEMVVRCYNNVGGTHFSMGQFAIAAQYYETALSMSKYFNDASVAFSIRCNLAEFYATLSEDKEANDVIAKLDEQDLSVIPQDVCCNYYLLKVRQAFLAGDNALYQVQSTKVRRIAESEQFQHVLFQLEMLKAQQYQSIGNIKTAIQTLQGLISGPNFRFQGIDRYRVIYLLAKWHLDVGDTVNIDRFLSLALSLEQVFWPHEILQKLALLVSQQLERMGDYKTALYHAREVRRWSELLRKMERDALTASQAKAALVADKEVQKANQAMEHRALEMMHEQTLMINAIGQSLASTLKSEEMALQLFESLAGFVPVSIIALIEISDNESRGRVRVVVEAGEVIDVPSEPFLLEGTRSQQAIQTRDMVHLPKIREAEDKILLKSGAHSASAVFFPLSVNDVIVGVWSLQSTQPYAYQKHHLELISALSAFVSIAFNNAQTHERNLSLISALNSEKKAVVTAHKLVAHQAQHDALTGLPNRIALKQFFAEQVQRVGESDQSFHVIFMDMNGFKSINDIHGHRVGDDVIVAIADRLKSFFRQSDIICRLGGDEFVAIIPQFNSDVMVEQFVNRIKTKVGKPFVVDDNSFHLGVSIGLSTYPSQGETLEDLLACADQNMYLDKLTKKKFDY